MGTIQASLHWFHNEIHIFDSHSITNSAHGQVKSVRIPNRADRRSRGFAFVDFATRKEAENAREVLQHTHLLGRHLVMEWAEKDGDVEEIRKKTMVQYGDGSHGKDLGKKEKLKLMAGDDDPLNDD